MASFAHLIKRWQQHSWHQRMKLLQAVGMLTVAKVLIAVFPIRWVLRLAGTHRQGSPDISTKPANPDFEALGKALKASAHYLPFSATCLVQAVAGAFILRFSRHHPIIVLGVQKKADADFAAHAWLMCDEQVVTGGEGREDFQVIARFISS